MHYTSFWNSLLLFKYTLVPHIGHIVLLQGFILCFTWYTTCILSYLLGYTDNIIYIQKKALATHINIALTSPSVYCGCIIILDLSLHLLPFLYILYDMKYVLYDFTIKDVVMAYALSRIWSFYESNGKTIYFYANDLYNLGKNGTAAVGRANEIFKLAYIIEFMCFIHIFIIKYMFI